MNVDLTKLADQDRDRFINLKRELQRNTKQNGSASFGWARAVLAEVDNVIGRENRIAFLLDAFGHSVESSKELLEPELFALAMWGKPTKAPMGGTEFCNEFLQDLALLQVVYNGQLKMPGLE